MTAPPARLAFRCDTAMPAPVPGRAPAHAGRPASRSVAKDFAARARISRSSLAGRTNDRKKCWLVITLAGSPTASGSGVFRLRTRSQVAPALAVPFLFTRRRLPVSLLRLPPRPFPRRRPAALAAIALAPLPGMKALRAPFQQQRRVRGRRAICRRPPAGFSTGLVGFSGGPMGGDDSQKLLPWRGIHSSPGSKSPAHTK